MADYAHFRQQLDAALRTQDFKQVQTFLIAQGQWGEDTPADPEYAMWMMIAATPALRDLHSKAREWLVSHGHTNDALAVLGRSQIEAEKRSKQRSFKKGPPSSRSGTSGKSGGNRSADNKPGAQKAPKRDEKN
ncbi:MAG: hypothetical protein NVSMB44_37950 [Ktedonobacteraceae bacterium]